MFAITESFANDRFLLFCSDLFWSLLFSPPLCFSGIGGDWGQAMVRRGIDRDRRLWSQRSECIDEPPQPPLPRQPVPQQCIGLWYCFTSLSIQWLVVHHLCTTQSQRSRRWHRWPVVSPLLHIANIHQLIRTLLQHRMNYSIVWRAHCLPNSQTNCLATNRTDRSHDSSIQCGHWESGHSERRRHSSRDL